MPETAIETPGAPEETDEETQPEETTGEPDAAPEPAPEPAEAPVDAPETSPDAGAWRDEDGAPASQDVPTLRQAFDTLARALVPQLEDNVPAQVQLHEARAMEEDGNVELPWSMLVGLLEDVLGVNLGR